MTKNCFRFKNFDICDDRCAMKVGTDGVLLGAWADVYEKNTILDVGSGSGLIALMMAQRSNALIDAIEIDKDAADQSKENIENSPWENRISIHHQPFSDYVKNSQKQFDLIVSNPPYFRNALKSKDQKRVMARHDDSLPYEVLMNGAAKLLNNTGSLALILPFNAYNEINSIALSKSLFCVRRMLVNTTINKPTTRILIEFKKEPEPIIDEKIIIQHENGYTDKYIELTKDFYLW